MCFLTVKVVLFLCGFGLYIGLVLALEDWHFTGNNVALNKPTTQLPGTYQERINQPGSHFLKKFIPDLAVDGNTDTIFSSLSCSTTSSGNRGTASWTVYLRQFYYITGIRIYNRHDYKNRLKSFEIIGNPTNTEIYNDANQNHQPLYNNEIINITLNGQHAYNSIRISIPQRPWTLNNEEETYLTLCEVEIFGASKPYVCDGIYTIGSPTSVHAEVKPGTGLRTDTKNSAGTVILFSCPPGYVVDGSTAIQCLDNGFYNATAPIYCNETCHDPQLTNGHYDVVNEYYNIDVRITAICDRGFRLDGTGTVTCVVGGRWSSKPMCLPITCNHPGAINNGFYSFSPGRGDSIGYYAPINFRFGKTLYINCNGGYKHSGPLQSIQCTWSGSWSGSQPICTRITCPIPAGNSDIRFTDNKGTLLYNSIKFGETITAACTRDLYRLKGSKLRTCKANGLLTGTEPSCAAICHRPLPVHGDYLDMNTQYDEGQSITLVCNAGYESTKPNTPLVCQNDHSWSNAHIQCNPKRCSFQPITNGSYDVTSSFIEYPETVSFECDQGFKITPGMTKRICKSDGKLSGTDPVCNEIFCSTNNLNPEKNHYEMIKYLTNSNRIRYNKVIQTTCKEGYARVTGSETRTCIDDDKFNEPELSCEVINCSPPSDVFQGAYNITAKYLTYLTNISFSCSNGYIQTEGSSTRHCQLDKTWSGEVPVCIAVESTSEQQSSRLPVIGGSAAGGIIVVVIVVVIGVIIFRRRRGLNSKPATKKSYTSAASPRPETSNADSEYAEIRETNIDSINLYTSVVPRHPTPYNDATLERSEQAYYSFSNPDRKPERAIRVADLSDLVLNGDKAREKFKKEFDSLPTGMKDKHTVALKQQNRAKNRYKDLYAYDASRVVLDFGNAKSETDYINANYVHGFNKIQAYVASQGATKEMIDDFWRMVWQIDCGKIVMLTNIIEENKEKCKQYWPTSGSMSFGKIEVTLKKTEMFSDFVIRTLAVGQHGNNDVKEILQFHFIAWPDKGVPKYASSLVNFRNKVKHKSSEREGPVVVHCSAGIGRTGTFIALDYLTDQAQALGYVDVAGCVETIRKQRVNLVQTLDQYIFIHHALVETLMLSPTAMPAAQFPAAYKEMLQIDDVQKKRKIDIAFEMLKKVSPVADEYQYVTAKHVRNRNKNRYSNILPVAECMPSLSSTDKQSDTDYINAVFLPSYKVRKAFIITQTPMEYTMHDFWRLLYEHDVHSVVMMNDVTEIKDTEVYWPEEGEEMTFGNIKVTNDGSESSEDQLVTTLKMKKFEKTRTIKQFCCQNWVPSATLPKHPSCILLLMELVQNWQQQTGNHPIVVHCMNGAERSGLFCVISAVIERMKIEQDVAITQVIEQMRNNREQIIPRQEQFQFCHESVITFMEQYETYSNFTT